MPSGLTVKKGDPWSASTAPSTWLRLRITCAPPGRSAKGTDVPIPIWPPSRRPESEQLAAPPKTVVLAGFTEEQLNAIAESGKVSDTATPILATRPATVVEKNILLAKPSTKAPRYSRWRISPHCGSRCKYSSRYIVSQNGHACRDHNDCVAWDHLLRKRGLHLPRAGHGEPLRQGASNGRQSRPGNSNPACLPMPVIRAPIGEFAEDSGTTKAANAASADKHEHAAPPAFPTTIQEDADRYLASLSPGPSTTSVRWIQTSCLTNPPSARSARCA